MVEVYGDTIDEETRCVHYHSKVDIIAIKFLCCQKYYPCFKCHNEHNEHIIQRWSPDQFDELMILCGKCGKQLTFNQYKSSNSCCYCTAQFNENCRLHYNLYFNIDKEGTENDLDEDK